MNLEASFRPYCKFGLGPKRLMLAPPVDRSPPKALFCAVEDSLGLPSELIEFQLFPVWPLHIDQRPTIEVSERMFGGVCKAASVELRVCSQAFLLGTHLSDPVATYVGHAPAPALRLDF